MEPADGKQTLRQQIIDLLGVQPLSLRDLSQALGVSEKELPGHLDHIDRSVRNQGRKLTEIPCRCLTCSYVFNKRTRFSKPGRCPKCRNSHLESARYYLK